MLKHTKSRAQKIINSQLALFFLWLVFLPGNLGWHLPQPYSYVYGYLVNYYLPTFYLTDLFLLGVLFFWGLELYQDKAARDKFRQLVCHRESVLLLTLLIILMPNLGVINRSSAWWGWLLWFKGYLLFLWLLFHLKSCTYPVVVKGLSVGVFSQALFGIYQVVQQQSVFGYLPFGETVLANSAGIAKGVFFNTTLIRAYGTTPHPNVLAGFLAVSWLVIYFSLGLEKKKLWRYWYLLTLFLGSLTLILTMSRSALIALLGSLFVYFMFRTRPKSRYPAWATPLLLIILLQVTGGLAMLNTPSVTERLSSYTTALSLIKKEPLLGIGLNNYIFAAQQYSDSFQVYRSTQPVHSVYLLLGAEGGVTALLILVLFLLPVGQSFFWQRTLYTKVGVLSLLTISIIGLFDHYLISLNQGLLLMFLVFGLAQAEFNKSVGGVN